MKAKTHHHPPSSGFDGQGFGGGEVFIARSSKNPKIHNQLADERSPFELDGQVLLPRSNGGPPTFKFNESISFFVGCKDQKEGGTSIGRGC